MKFNAMRSADSTRRAGPKNFGQQHRPAFALRCHLPSWGEKVTDLAMPFANLAEGTVRQRNAGNHPDVARGNHGLRMGGFGRNGRTVS